MQIGGTLISAVVKILVLGATLALFYVFIIRPVLDTTETVTAGVNDNISNAMDEVNQAFEETDLQNGGYSEVKIKRSITNTSGQKQQRLLTCVQGANQDIDKIQRCVARFGP